jgi:hypothetical protein
MSVQREVDAFIAGWSGASKWQTIDTAPFNEAVLVFVPNREHYGHAVYRAIRCNFHPNERAPYWHSCGLAVGRDIPSDSEPTHWMPLPEPPK